MEKQNESMRDRLLARLPQPENLAAYQEETTALLAKHEKAMFWEKWGNTVLSLCVVGLFLFSFSTWVSKLGSAETNYIRFVAGFMWVGVMIDGLKVYNYRNQVSLLKEVKEVQLQILELQASLQKDGNQ
jgi:hypothetical protein